MASNKTRLSSNARQQLMQMGSIRPASEAPKESVSFQRAIGNRTASHINAVLARRASFHNSKSVAQHG